MEALQLLRGVRELSLLVDTAAPEAVSQRAFDAERERRPKPAALPPARRITEQLRLSWRDVLTIAHEPEERHAQLLGAKTRTTPADWITAEHVRTALQLVAARLDVDSLTAREYRVERAQLLAADRARWRYGRWLLLPDDEQIIGTAGSWDAALSDAGLKTTAQRRPAREQSASKLADLMERFYDHYGVQPSLRNLRAFALGNGIPYPMRTQPFRAAVAEWVASRRERSLPEPRVVTRVGGRGHKAPDYSADVGAARPGERRLAKWTRADCAAAVARYLAQLPTGERSTERGYTDWAATQPRGTTPAMNTILEHGGWEAVRRDAQDHAESPKEIVPIARTCNLMASKKDPLIAAGEQIVNLLEKAKYSRPHVLALIENLEKGASERSDKRKEKHWVNEWQKIITTLWHIKSSLENGVAPDPKQVANLADALTAAERRQE